VAYQLNSLPRLILVHGDFTLMRAPEDFGGAFDAAWDRAALTSIAPAERPAYVARIAAALRPGARALFEFLSSDAPGAAEAAVEAGAARELIAAAGFASVRLLSRRDVRAEYPAFRPPGMTYLDEVVMLAEKGVSA
jgi:hypothetical protein